MRVRRHVTNRRDDTRPHSAYLPAVLLLIVLPLVRPADLIASPRRVPKLNDNVALPSSFEFDLSLGARQRAEMLSDSTRVVNDPAESIGEDVFSRLIRDRDIAQLGLPYQWTFAVKTSAVVNASSTADGAIVANSAMAKLIGTNRGLWAAVLSHEISHTFRRHIVQEVLFHMYVQQQVEYWKTRQRLGDKNAGWAVAAISIAGKIAEKKLSRDLEHDADVQGMLLMARAGYHPDYVFALHHLLRANTGEQSKFTAFFSDHPRWATRDQKEDRVFSEALAEYNRLWPDPTISPGGEPPPVAFLTSATARQNKQQRTNDIMVSLTCRNVSSPVTLRIRFRDDRGNSVNSDIAQYRDTSGNLEISVPTTCRDTHEIEPTTIHLPFGLLASAKGKKIKTQVDVLTATGEFLEASKEMDLRAPKQVSSGDYVGSVQVEQHLADKGAISGSALNRPILSDGTQTRGNELTHEPIVVAAVKMPPLSVNQRAEQPLPVTGEPKDLAGTRNYLDPAIRHNEELIAAWWNHPSSGSAQQPQTNQNQSQLVFSTPQLKFPPQELGTSSSPASVTVNNTGSSPFVLTNIRISGVHGEDFTQSNTCGGQIPAKSGCIVTVRFKPVKVGSRSAALTLYDLHGRPELVLLDGTGTQTSP